MPRGGWAAAVLLCVAAAAPRNMQSREDDAQDAEDATGSWAVDDRRHHEDVEVNIEIHTSPWVRSVAVVKGAELHEVSRCSHLPGPTSHQSRPLRRSSHASLHRLHSGATGGSSRSGVGAAAARPSS